MPPSKINRSSRLPPHHAAKSISSIGWAPSQELDVTEWAAMGRRIGTVGRCVQWVLGDWIAYGNLKFGERYARAAKITGYDPQTLMNMVYVASRFPISRRREELSWSHHEALSAFEAEEQDRWLDQATHHRWSVADLRAMLRVSRRERREKGKGGEESMALLPSSPWLVRCPRCGEKIPVAEPS